MPRRSGSTTPDEAAGRVPVRRRGGQELPDEVQDRPEQNAGYDAVAHEGEPIPEGPDMPLDPAAQESLEDLGDPAEREVRKEIRRRQHSDR
jgi:hypothetical protein